MDRWLKEPLVHFVLLGGLLFAAYAGLNRGDSANPQVVRISAAEVAWLTQTWARQWQRPPDERELRGLVTDYVKETLLAREALALGLDENDTIVRRRLAQKMTFLVEDTARLAEPKDQVLRKYYAEHSERYQVPASISFSQRFFSTERAASEALKTLVHNLAAEVGERSLLPSELTMVDAQAVSNAFGPQFNEQVFALEAGKWQGPIASAYGFHLLRIDEKQPARLPSFEIVHERVLEDWYRRQQERVNEKYFARLLEKYDVIVEDEVKPIVGPLAEAMQ